MMKQKIIFSLDGNLLQPELVSPPQKRNRHAAECPDVGSAEQVKKPLIIYEFSFRTIKILTTKIYN